MSLSWKGYLLLPMSQQNKGNVVAQNDESGRHTDIKRLILVAYHFPPCKVSSGIQRTLKFTTYLRERGWHGSILTVHPRAYDVRSGEQMAEIPKETRVVRAWAWDTQRHLSVCGRYVRWFSLPDRWVTWWPGAIASGIRLVQKERPAVIWSTYPVATAHLIGLSLHRLTGLPWVADFRDSMTEADYPPNPHIWRSYRWIERHAIANCARAVFTTPGALRMYERRYPDLLPGKGVVIPNGYDEENFIAAKRDAKAPGEPVGRPLQLVHSGVLYPQERDPRPFFKALARLKHQGKIDSRTLQVTLRATGRDELHRASAQEAGVDDIVVFAPPLPYGEALREMLEADGLLLFQAANCNHQIPAKVYEYFRAGRPIFTLTDPAGDTAAAVQEAGLDNIAPLDDTDAIAREFAKFVLELRAGRLAGASTQAVAQYSRRSLTARLADLLDEVTSAAGSQRLSGAARNDRTRDD